MKVWISYKANLKFSSIRSWRSFILIKKFIRIDGRRPKRQ